MARLDGDTKEFAAAIGLPAEQSKPVEKQVETAIRTARAIVKNPKKFVARKIIAKAVDGEAEKIASMDPVAVFHTLNSQYGVAWHDWEPETLWRALPETLTSGEPDRAVKDLIMALQVSVNTDAPFEHWHIFENVANAFAGNPVDFGVLQPVELTDAAKAIRVLLSIRPKILFDREVWAYIAALAKQSGVVYLPASLFGGSTVPQEILDSLNNDLGLKKEVSSRWPKAPTAEDSLSVKIQLLRLKEIEEAVRA